MTFWEQAPADGGETRDKAGGRVVLVVVVVLALLVGGAWVAAYAVAGDETPRGASVEGVEIGGRSQDEAVAALEEGLAGRVAQPVTVTVGSESSEVDPASAGLSVDYEASVAGAGGERSWNPKRLWDHFTGGDDAPAVVDVDEAAMDAALDTLQTELGGTARDGAVAFVDGGLEITEARAGRGFEDVAAAEALTSTFVLEDREVELTLTDVQPDIDDADVREAVDSFANPALTGPVEMVFGDDRVELTPAQYSAALSLEPQGGELVPTVDEEVLSGLVEDGASGAGAPVDATVRLVDGAPQVVPAEPGVAYAPADVASSFLEVVTRPEGQREVEVASTPATADFTTRDARRLRITEKVSEFETFFPYAEYRNTNLGRAAEIIDGTVLKPGETFSMNDIVGERTRENGFTEGFVISDGIFKEDLGGGVSQMATTLFNGMFFAGLEDVEHKPHSFYIDRYPVGREATVVFGALDLRFKNDTEHGVLVEVDVTPSSPSGQGTVRVALWSTKVWDIETTTSDRYAYVDPATRVLDTPDCYANSGSAGFQVDVERIFKRPGSAEVVRTETFHTDYTPSDTVVCRPPGSLSQAPAGGGRGGGGG